MFEKISLEQYLIFARDTNNINKESQEEYDNIKIPQRSTTFSAGYDFISPTNIHIRKNEYVTLGTGIKWDGFALYNQINKVDKNKSIALFLYPRSSLGFKYGFRFANTVPVIDLDYYDNPSNEGHIILKFTVKEDSDIKAGEKICQGIITPIFIETDDNINIKRVGGIGSTNIEHNL